MALGWRWRQKCGKGWWREGRGGVLEQEEAVEDRFEGMEENGAH
jgi:hypothetical protein